MSKVNYYEQNGVAMTCRSFKEYEEMFMLDENLVQKGKVLDVASGASSFVSDLCNREFDAVAVDPLYKLSIEEMERLGLRENESVAEKLEKVKHLYVWDSYGSLEGHNQIRRESFRQFLDCYKRDVSKETFIPAQLPILPFEEETFSLILCNHFLFLYQEQFDYNFHLQAISELIRVAKKGGVIRIYPLVGFKNELYPHLNKLTKELECEGVEIELTKTNFRFLPAATHFLSIKK